MACIDTNTNRTEFNRTDIAGWIYASQAWAGTVAIVGVFGNAITIIIILWQTYLWRRYKTGRPRSLSNLTSRSTAPAIPYDGYTLLLLNLCICDLLYCGIQLPITTYTYSYYFRNDTPSKPFCTGAALFRYQNALVEWLTLALIAVQRCVDLRHSRYQRYFTTKATIIYIGIIWITSTVPQFIILLPDAGGYAYDGKSFKCDIINCKGRLIFYTLEFSLPCFLMLIGYCSIIYQILSNVRTLRKNGMPEELIKDRRRGMIKSVTLIMALLSLFLICVTPICIYNILSLVSLGDNLNVPLGIAIFMIYWIQYGVNFFVYVWRNDSFKKAFKQFLFAVSPRKLCGLKEDHDDTPAMYSNAHYRSRRIPTISYISERSMYGRNISSNYLIEGTGTFKTLCKGNKKMSHTLSVASLLSDVNSYMLQFSIYTETTQLSE